MVFALVEMAEDVKEPRVERGDEAESRIAQKRNKTYLS